MNFSTSCARRASYSVLDVLETGAMVDLCPVQQPFNCTYLRPRWRTASYSSMPVATETLRLSDSAETRQYDKAKGRRQEARGEKPVSSLLSAFYLLPSALGRAVRLRGWHGTCY